MMKHAAYDKAEAHVVRFDNSDVVTTSPATTSETTQYFCHDNFDVPGHGCSDGVSSTIWGD